MNYSRNRYNDLDDSLGPNDVEFPSDENDQGRDRDIENLRPLNLEPITKMSDAPTQQGNVKYNCRLSSSKENFNAFRDFTPGGILKTSQHIQKMQKDSNKFTNKYPDRNHNNGSYYNKNPKFQRNNQQPPLFRDEQDQPISDSKNHLCNLNRGNNSFSQNNFSPFSQRPPSKFVYSNQNSMNNSGLPYSNNNKRISFNHSKSNGSGPLREMNRNVTNNNNFKTSSFAPNNNQQRPRNHFQENNHHNNSNNQINTKSQSNSNPVATQNNLLNLFGNLSNLLKPNNSNHVNNNNSMRSNSNDQSNSMALSTIFESLAVLQAFSNSETLSQTLNLLNTIKNSNPQPENNSSQPILVEEDKPATEAFSPEDPSGSEIMGNNVPTIQKENTTHSFSFLEMLNNNGNRPESVNHKKPKTKDQGTMTPPPIGRRNPMNQAEKENQQPSSGINKNKLATKLELLLSLSSKEKSPQVRPEPLESNKKNKEALGVKEEEIETPEISPEKTPTKHFPREQEILKSPPRPNTFRPFVEANITPLPTSQLLNSQLMNFGEESKNQQQPEVSKPKLLDFFEDKVQIGGKEKEVEKHQRQYKLLGSDRPLLTQEKNLLEKLERFANEEKKNPEEKKTVEQDEKEDDEFNFESRYFMYNPTKVCNRCRKPGHFEKMCTEENLVKCGFCVGSHKMANCDQIVCFKCLKVGHRMQNCKSQHSATCFRCQKKGHTYHNCGIMMAKDPRTTVADKERDMGQIKCLSCNQFGHVNCKSIKKTYVDDLYQDYSSNGPNNKV